MSLALNCNTHSSEDVEVISNLIRIRLKTKPLANHYMNCIKYVHIVIDMICKKNATKIPCSTSTPSSLNVLCS